MIKAVFVMVPSFTSLGLYIGIAVLLARNKMRNCGGVTLHAFITISILLALFYISHWPALLFRDFPKLFNTSLNLPNKISIAMSVFYYLNTLTDPIVYGFRSKYLFRNTKTIVGVKMSQWSNSGGNDPSQVCVAPNNTLQKTATVSTAALSTENGGDIVLSNVNSSN